MHCSMYTYINGQPQVLSGKQFNALRQCRRAAGGRDGKPGVKMRAPRRSAESNINRNLKEAMKMQGAVPTWFPTDTN